jgi:hypothetical protein
MEVPLRDLASFRPAPAGLCIYCGARENLSAEHILPYGLSGPAEIPLASCPRCARITGAVEQEVLRGAMWPLRVYRDLGSRTKHRDAPKTVDVTLVFANDREKLVRIPIDEAPILFFFPMFAPPAVVDPTGYTKGIRVRGVATVGFGEAHKDIGKRYGSKSFTVSQTTSPVTFARMIAKIAYAMAVADGSLERLGAKFPVVESILNRPDDVGRWVGSSTDLPPRHPTVLHNLVGRRFEDTRLCSVLSEWSPKLVAWPGQTSGYSQAP